MTYDELKDQVERLAQKLEDADVEDPKVLNARIKLRQLLNQMELAALPTLGAQTPDVDVEALILAVDTDIAHEAARANLVVKIGKLASFVAGIIA